MMTADHLLGALAGEIRKLRTRAARADSIGSVVTLALEAYAAGRKRGAAEGWSGAASRMAWVLDEATAQFDEDADSLPQLRRLVEAERQAFAKSATAADVEASQRTSVVEQQIRAAESAQPLGRRLGAWLLLVGSQLSARGAS
jgi:hypothetical protein